MTYSYRGDEWDRLPWLVDVPRRRRPTRSRPLLPVWSIALLMVIVAVGSFLAGSLSVQAEQRGRTVAHRTPAIAPLDAELIADELLTARTFVHGRPRRPNAPY